MMTIQFFDGFDHYDPGTEASIKKKWGLTTAISLLTTAPGRSGSGNALEIENNSRDIGMSVPIPRPELIWQWAFKVDNAGPSSTNGWLTAVNTDDLSSPVEFHLELSPGGFLRAMRGSTILGTGTTAVVSDKWHHCQIRLLLDNAAGEVEVYLDGSNTPEINVTGVDNSGGASVNIESIRLSSCDTSPTFIDDFVLLDKEGVINNDFIGDRRIGLINPDGDEGTNNFIAVGAGATKADRVNEAISDDDTTYLHSSTPGDIELLTYGPITGSVGSISAVQVVSDIKKDDGGIRTVRNLLKHGAVIANGATVGLSTEYALNIDVFELNPSTSALWTEPEVNALSAGLEVVT